MQKASAHNNGHAQGMECETETGNRNKVSPLDPYVHMQTLRLLSYYTPDLPISGHRQSGVPIIIPSYLHW